MVHELNRSFGLLQNVVEPDLELGTNAALERYHSPDYLDSLANGDGLEHDCPHFNALPSYVRFVAASTSTACRLLLQGTDIAINWDGGRHHARRSEASGFCYVADIVLGIMLLAKQGKRNGRRPRIMYLDLDLHYGDGVAKAFHVVNKTPQVLTLSIHHASTTFFPQTPLAQLPSSDTASPFTLSIPLEAFPSNATYRRVFDDCIEPIKQAFDPDYVVLQLGADGLPNDRIGQYGAWSVDGEGSMTWCVQRVKDWRIPLCVLGGGGYDHANTARAWALATAVLMDEPIEVDTPVPDHDYFPAYAPGFTLQVAPSYAPDTNQLDHTCDVYAKLARRLYLILASSASHHSQSS